MSHFFRAISIAICVTFGSVNLAPAQEGGIPDEQQGAATAPPKTREVGKAPGGAYFVDEALLDQLEAIKTRLTQVRDEISLGKASSEAALKTLGSIQQESRRVRDEIEKTKVLVSVFQVFTRTTELTFPLGEERLVIVTGDSVIVRGWDGPDIKCVLEKTIVAKAEPDDKEFDAITVQHEHSIAEKLVGRTKEVRDQEEEAFLNSEAGSKLNDEQKVKRKLFVDEIHHSYDDYAAFQGKNANSIQLTGLTYQEGNRQLVARINSPGGGGSMSSKWQRHATMTVYVPACKSLLVRGCEVGLDIQDVECDLILTSQGSRDKNYEGSFTVRGVKGNVTIDQAPVRVLSNVSGNVRFTATDEFVNSGTHHEGGRRTSYFFSTQTTEIDHIGGDLQATFLRTDLKLSAIGGVMNVVNRYGTSQLTVNAVDAEHAHRIISESGKISVDGPADVLTKTPIYAYTQCGRLHTDLSQEILDDLMISTGKPRMGWHGFITPSKERFDMARFERPADALNNRKRPPGLDLISHAGDVSILTTGVSK